MTSAAFEKTSSVKCFRGNVEGYKHQSETLKCEMKFSVYIPESASDTPCPVLFYLSGLTCTDQNFVTKAGGFKYASEKNMMIVCPDTSPRGLNIQGQDDSYDFGSGAGFYVTATESPWKENYNMYDYVTKELVDLLKSNFNVNSDKFGITGHSMGGHGALICALKNPTLFKSVSAFAPICNPTKCPWGEKAFKGYLGSVEAGKEWDATELVKNCTDPLPFAVLIDQGTEDGFYKEKQLLPENFIKAAAGVGCQVALRMQEGYDHSYFFISTFIGDHIEHHAKYLC